MEEIVYYNKYTKRKAIKILVDEGFSKGAAQTAVDALIAGGIRLREKLPYIEEIDADVDVRAAPDTSGSCPGFGG